MSPPDPHAVLAHIAATCAELGPGVTCVTWYPPDPGVIPSVSVQLDSDHLVEQYAARIGAPVRHVAWQGEEWRRVEAAREGLRITVTGPHRAGRAIESALDVSIPDPTRCTQVSARCVMGECEHLQRGARP